MASGDWSGTIVENFSNTTLTAAMGIYSTVSGTLSVTPINGGMDMLVVGVVS